MSTMLCSEIYRYIHIPTMPQYQLLPHRQRYSKEVRNSKLQGLPSMTHCIFWRHASARTAKTFFRKICEKCCKSSFTSCRQADSEWNLHIPKGPCMNFCKLNTVTLNCSRRLCTHELPRMFTWSDINWYITIWSGCKQCYELHNAIQGGAFCNMSSKMHH